MMKSGMMRRFWGEALNAGCVAGGEQLVLFFCHRLLSAAGW